MAKYTLVIEDLDGELSVSWSAQGADETAPTPAGNLAIIVDQMIQAQLGPKFTIEEIPVDEQPGP